MIKYKNITCPIYDVNMEFIYSKTGKNNFEHDIHKIARRDESLQFLQKYETPFCYVVNGWKGVKNLQQRCVYIIFFENTYLKQHLDTAVIAHESFHAACEIMKVVGEEYDYKHQEPWAYLVEYVTKECCSFLKSHKVNLR